MQLFSYNPHHFLLLAFSSFLLFNNMLYCFSQHFLTSQHVLCFLQHVFLLLSSFIALTLFSQPSWDRICLNLMFMLRSTCLFILSHVFAQIYFFMLRSMCLCALCHVCVLRSICWYAMCLYSPLVPRCLSFLCFGPYWWGVDLDPVVQAYIDTPRPISKVWIISFMNVYVCLISSMP